MRRDLRVLALLELFVLSGRFACVASNMLVASNLSICNPMARVEQVFESNHWSTERFDTRESEKDLKVLAILGLCGRFACAVNNNLLASMCQYITPWHGNV